MPETAAALRTLAELSDDDPSATLDDDSSEPAEDGSAAGAATGTWEGKIVAVVGAAEDKDFGLFPAGQAAETQTAEMAKSTTWSFILSKGTCGQADMLECLIKDEAGILSANESKERTVRMETFWSKE